MNETKVCFGTNLDCHGKMKDIDLPGSVSYATKRLLCTEREIDKNLIYGKAYCDKRKDLLDANYVKKTHQRIN